MIEPTQAGIEIAKAMAIGIGGGLGIALLIVLIITALFHFFGRYNPVVEAEEIARNAHFRRVE